MKTKIEVLGYEIEIEENDGVVSVKAELDGETVEEFTLETPEGQDGQGQAQGQDDDEVKGFEEFGSQEEEDFDGQGQAQGQAQDQDDEESQSQLESFQSFINRKK